MDSCNLIRFDGFYAASFVIVFCTEAAIGLFLHDGVVRPYVGDILVVILVYAFLKMIFAVRPGVAISYVLIFAFCVECLQGLHLLRVLGWQRSALARAVLGTSFSWADILMYGIGAGVVLAAEKIRCARRDA